MPTSLYVMMAALPVLLVLSAFFSGSETALFCLTQLQRARLSRSAHVIDLSLATLLAETRSLLITLLMGNMTINVLYFVISSVILIRLGSLDILGPAALTAMSLAPLLLIILLGEVLPKLVAARLSLGFARLCAVPLLMVHRALSPIRLVTAGAVIGPLARLIAPQDSPSPLSENELDTLLTLSQRQGVIDPGEQTLLQQALELGRIRVRELMTHRVDMVGHDLRDSPDKLMRLIKTSGMRRIPIYQGDWDRVVGKVRSRQVLLKPPRNRKQLRDMVEPINYVPEQQRADQLLEQMRDQHMSLAVVVDEYGGTAGLVTIEDVIEHVVGQLPTTEIPEPGPQVEQLKPGCWLVGANLPVHDWPEVLGQGTWRFTAGSLSMVSTLAGLVMAMLGRLAQTGDTVRLGNIRLTVHAMAGQRIETILVELVGKDETATTEPGEAPA